MATLAEGFEDVVPMFRLPITLVEPNEAVDSEEPLTLPENVPAAAAIVPVKVGLADNTVFPVPVLVVTPVPPRDTAKVPLVISAADQLVEVFAIVES